MYCPHSLYILNRSHHEDYGIGPEPPKTLSEVYYELSRLTIKNLLDLTPSVSNLIVGCQVRGGTMSRPVVMRKKECGLYFKVMKSVYGENICYTFLPTVQANFSAGDVTSSLSHKSSVYHISLRPIISRTLHASFISSGFNHNGKVKSFLHSRLFQANTENRKTLNQSRITVYGDSIEINRLSSPYDTQCTPGHDREMCYEECLTDKFKAINRVPWSGFHREELSIKMLTTVDFLNETILKCADKSFEECQFRCKLKTECLSQFTRTTIQEYQAPAFSVVSVLPSQPHISVYAIPVLRLVEYIVQVGSCFGMWFGLSITSFNPDKWIKRILPKKDRTSRVVRNHNRILFWLIRNRVHT